MKTHEAYIEELAEKNPGIECLGYYVGATKKILHRCSLCGHEWLVRPTSLVSNKPKGCPHCAAVKAGRAYRSYTSATYAARLAEVNEEIELSGQYKGSHKKAEFFCRRCGHKWSAMPYSVLQGHGCPKCAKSGTSFMEQVFLRAIRDCVQEEVFERDKSAIGEELDIYIPAKMLAFEPGSWALHKDRLWKDKQKRLLAKEAGIRLVMIYDKFSESEEIPFEQDCLVYSDDFNKDDHAVLWQYVREAVSLLGIDTHRRI